MQSFTYLTINTNLIIHSPINTITVCWRSSYKYRSWVSTTIKQVKDNWVTAFVWQINYYSSIWIYRCTDAVKCIRCPRSIVFPLRASSVRRRICFWNIVFFYFRTCCCIIFSAVRTSRSVCWCSSGNCFFSSFDCITTKLYPNLIIIIFNNIIVMPIFIYSSISVDKSSIRLVENCIIIEDITLCCCSKSIIYYKIIANRNRLISSTIKGNSCPYSAKVTITACIIQIRVVTRSNPSCCFEVCICNIWTNRNIWCSVEVEVFHCTRAGSCSAIVASKSNTISSWCISRIYGMRINGCGIYIIMSAWIKSLSVPGRNNCIKCNCIAGTCCFKATNCSRFNRYAL